MDDSIQSTLCAQTVLQMRLGDSVNIEWRDRAPRRRYADLRIQADQHSSQRIARADGRCDVIDTDPISLLRPDYPARLIEKAATGRLRSSA